MSETERVQRWREAKRQKGLKPCTVWLTPAEELRLKDLASQRRKSPSEIIQEALAQFSSVSQPDFSNSADTELLREMIREEVSVLQAVSASATITDTEQLRALIQAELAQIPPVTALVTDTVTDTMAATLPALVRTIVEGLAFEALGMPVTATDNSYETDIEDPEETHEALYDDDTVTNSNVTETETHRQTLEEPHANITDINSNVADTETSAAAPARPAPAPAQNGPTAQVPAPRRRGRTSTLRQPILNLLHAHPEGLTAAQLRVYMDVDRNIGDVLQGMVRNQLLTKQGSGAQVRYRAARTSEPPTVPRREASAMPAPSSAGSRRPGSRKRGTYSTHQGPK